MPSTKTTIEEIEEGLLELCNFRYNEPPLEHKDYCLCAGSGYKKDWLVCSQCKKHYLLPEERRIGICDNCTAHI